MNCSLPLSGNNLFLAAVNLNWQQLPSRVKIRDNGNLPAAGTRIKNLICQHSYEEYVCFLFN